MKKNAIFLLLALVLASPTITFAATPTPVMDESLSQKLDAQINNLKDKIASRVAQLNLVEKRGIIGTVTEVSDTKLTIKDLKGDDRPVDVDEITKFSSPTTKDASFGISDITKGTKISVLGLYNKESKRTLARFIDVVTVPKFIDGQIASINKPDFSLTVISENGKTTTIDIENITKTTSYDADLTPVKSGFSKMEVGERINIVGYPNKKDEARLIATRILLFPDLPKNPKIVIPESALTNTSDQITPSTGSGKKVTPLR